MKQVHEIQNLRQIKVKFVGATNTRGSRIKIYEAPRYNDEKEQSKMFSYDYSVGNVEQQAFNILEANGFKIVARCSEFNNYVILCNNWGDEFIQIKDLK
jgi:sRNA-binding regulator protein Hfq